MDGPSPHAVDRLIRLALDEDLPHGDVTSAAVIAPGTPAAGRFVARAPLVLAGTGAAARVFALVDPRIRVGFTAADGSHVEAGAVVGEVAGDAHGVLAGERTALNLLQRLSGIASLTARFVAAAAGTRARIVDTRKTTPGLRGLEKAAVRAGGGASHRASLSDGVLIKTNHVRVAGSVAAAVSAARARACHTLRIEVEVRDEAELEQALAAGADTCLLDNMAPDRVRRCVAIADGRCRLEASGGIRLDNVRSFAETGVDLISVGALTHSAPAADLALEVELGA